MTKPIEAAGYMIQDVQGNAIFGIGETVEEAWAKVVEDAGPFFNAYGDEISNDEAYETKFKAYGASAALMTQVQEYGGLVAWGMVRGVACTEEEEDQATN